MERNYKFLCLIFILLSGLSFRLGFDSIGYEFMFNYNYGYDINWNDFFNGVTGYGNSEEPLWYLLNWFIYRTFAQFWILKLLIAVFSNCTIFWFIRRHCPVPFTAILVYFVFGFIEYNFETLRQAMSISLFLIALDQLIGENNTEFNFKKYYIWIIPALFFHHFAIITLVIPLLTRFKLNLQVIFIVTGVSLGLGYITEIVLGVSNLSFLSPELSENIVDKMHNETYGVYGGLNIVGIAFKILTLVLPGIYLLKHHHDDALTSLALVYYIMVFSQFYFHFLYRVADYMIIPLGVALATSLKNGFNSSNGYKAEIVLFCFVFILGKEIIDTISSDSWRVYYPYSSIIEKSIDDEREYLFREHRTNDYYMY